MDRAELERELRLLYVAHQGGSDFPHKHPQCDWCDKRMVQVMALVDEYTAALPPSIVPRESLWSSEQVRKFLKLKSTDHARVTMSRWSIAAVHEKTGHGGQGRAYYPIKDVRAEAERRGWVSA